jgi:sirohydrochlorin cobaltochelatase
VDVVDKKPSKELLIEKIVRSDIRQLTLVLLMLVAGVHVEEDLAGEEEFWKKCSMKKILGLQSQKKGVGYNKNIITIFINQIQHALDLIPEHVK